MAKRGKGTFRCQLRSGTSTGLFDIAPDGAAINLISPGLDVESASYRDLKRGRQLLSPGKIYELRLERLQPIS